VVVAGTPLDFRLGFGRFGDARVVHVVDAPGRVATHVELADSAAGDLTACLVGMAAAGTAGGRVAHAAWTEQLQGTEQELRRAEQAVLDADAEPIKPSRVFGELARRLDRDAVVIGDGGDFVSYAGRYVDTFEPGGFLDPGPYGCLGTGPGYALGAALGRPGRQLVLLLGDGAVGFSLGDWDTLARHGIPVVGIVGNNAGWGLEKTPMKKLYGYHVVADLAERTRYDEAAVALGCHGELVERPADIGPALDRAFAAGGPALVNVITDPDDEYPRRSTLG
jgi:acetolactate synthase-1/2/3 large subunit